MHPNHDKIDLGPRCRTVVIESTCAQVDHMLSRTWLQERYLVVVKKATALDRYCTKVMANLIYSRKSQPSTEESLAIQKDRGHRWPH